MVAFKGSLGVISHRGTLPSSEVEGKQQSETNNNFQDVFFFFRHDSHKGLNLHIHMLVILCAFLVDFPKN